MKPFRVSRTVSVAALVLLGLLPAQGSPRAAGAEPLLRPTPLVLKDGRIANVSIHVLPFASGQAELAAAPAEYLAKLTRAVGTDCFLTAQVIGHIASDEIAGDDTLNAHRLARSRADAVQASLIGGGLPAKAIASVWDWQFMVREPRATLWVFELTAGEDCEGRQLHGDLVAEAPATEQGNAAPERVTKPAVAPAETPDAPAATAAKPAATAAKPAATAAKPAATARGEAAPKPAQPATAQPPVIAQAEAVPPAAAAPAARPQAEPGQARQAAAKLTEPAPAAESKPAASRPTRRADGPRPHRRPRRRPNPPSRPPRPQRRPRRRPNPPSRPPRPHRRPRRRPNPPSRPPRPQRRPRRRPSPPSRPPRPHRRPPAPAQSVEHTATAAPQTVARAEPAEQAAIAAAPAATSQSPVKPSTDDGKVENGPQGGLVITFATNSSYFPSGAAAQLRELLAGVNGEKKYQVTLQVAVSGTTQVVGAKSADEAARYNRWLADRRVERVQAWLVKNAGAQALSIKPEYVANDNSRRLTVRFAPVG